MQFKKSFATILMSTLVLTACGGNISSLKTEEKAIYDINESSGTLALNLAENLNKEASEMPSYETVWKISREASEKLTKNADSLEKVSFADETSQIKENSIINLNSTLRIVDKITELSDKARSLLTDNTSEADQTARDAKLQEINLSLNGFRGRLEKSKEKFDNLNTQLLEESAANKKE